MLKYILSFCYHLKIVLTTIIIVIKRKNFILNQICFLILFKIVCFMNLSNKL